MPIITQPSHPTSHHRHATAGNWRKRLIAAGLVTMLLIILLIITIYILVTYRPSAYHPCTLTKAQQQSAEQHGWKKSQEFYNNINWMKPFTISLDETMFNDLLMLDVTNEFLGRTMSSADGRLRYVQLSLTQGQINLMAQFHYKGLSGVLTVVLEPIRTEQNRLQLTIAAVRIGAMPLGRGTIARALRPALTVLQQHMQKDCADGNNNRNQRYNNELIDYLLGWAAEFCQQQRIGVDHVFQATEDKDKLAFINEIRISDGRIELDIEPVTVQQ